MNQGFEIVTTTAGAVSIRDFATGEIMHNPVGPWAEANALYIDQSRLDERLLAAGDELVIFDVGLGAAANALAVLHRARALTPRRPIHLVSFERDLSLLEFALEHADRFPHFAGYETAVRALRDHGTWTEPGLRWSLRHGDYPALIEREPTRADLVFFEPYSPLKNPDMWTTAVFRGTFDRTKPGALLMTYSCATPIRVAMLLAGFYVGAGTATGKKGETTQAARRPGDLTAPLGEAWLGRWQRSHTPNAAGAGPETLAANTAAVLAHPQFKTGQVSPEP